MRGRVFFGLALLAVLALAGMTTGRTQWFDSADTSVADGSANRAADSVSESGETDDTVDLATAGRTHEAASTPSAPDAVKDPSQTSAENPSIPLISAATANALMREQLREQDCQRARMAIKGSRQGVFEGNDWNWLPPEKAELERQALVAAVERFQAQCPPEIEDPEARKRRQQDNDDAIAAAARAGNLLARARMEFKKPRAERNLDDIRALMIETLRSGDLEAISELGWLELRLPGTNALVGHLVSPLDLWPLVACDLGADCGPGSRILDLSCATYSFGMTCGYDSLESAYRDNMQPHQWQRLDQRRNEILNRLRSGQTSSMFDPPTERTGSGGG
ncbi:MAG: hypothetical protein KDI60_21605 [Xanthomonadales bacterium]|nr:hypothetical protein [Xanthomonadales bacterium]